MNVYNSQNVICNSSRWAILTHNVSLMARCGSLLLIVSSSLVLSQVKTVVHWTHIIDIIHLAVRGPGLFIQKARWGSVARGDFCNCRKTMARIQVSYYNITQTYGICWLCSLSITWDNLSFRNLFIALSYSPNAIWHLYPQNCQERKEERRNRKTKGTPILFCD